VADQTNLPDGLSIADNWRGANRASNKLASPRLGSHNFSKLNAM